MNKYNMIVAADKDWCIGKDRGLLDNFPEDMMFFRNTTNNKTVIMGLNTQLSLPNHSYLKNRMNIILTPHDKWQCLVSEEDDNTYVLPLNSIDQIPDFITVLKSCQTDSNRYLNYNFDDENIFVIGGGQVYRQFLEKDLIDTIYLTKIDHCYHGDTFIPNLYELGFKDQEVILPETTNYNGIKYTIVRLTK